MTQTFNQMLALIDGAAKPAEREFDVMGTIDPDYAESFERDICQLCNCRNGHSLSCVVIQRDAIEGTASPASLMLADLAIPYSQDDATVAMLDRELPIADVWFGESEDVRHRAWADQFGKDIVAAGEARAKAAKR